MVPHEKKQVFLHHLNIQNFSPEIVEFIKLMTPNIKMMESEVVSENQKKLNCTIKHLTQ
jgi:hypothetical protein